MSRDGSKLPGKTEPLLEPRPGGYRDAAPREPTEPTQPIPEEKGWKAQGPLSAEDAKTLDEEIAFLTELVSQLRGEGRYRYEPRWGNPGIPYWRDAETGHTKGYPHDLDAVERELAIYRRLRAIDMSLAELSRRRAATVEREMRRAERAQRWRAFRAKVALVVCLSVIVGSVGVLLIWLLRALIRWIAR